MVLWVNSISCKEYIKVFEFIGGSYGSGWTK